MRLSTKGRYSLRVMLELAKNYYSNQNNTIDLKTIAKNQNLSIKYLEHIISSLKNVGLVTSTRGITGGYHLSRDPEKITLLDILQATENITNIVECLENANSCKLSKICATFEIWNGLKEVITKYFQSQTLKDLLKIHTRKISKNAKIR